MLGVGGAAGAGGVPGVVVGLGLGEAGALGDGVDPLPPPEVLPPEVLPPEVASSEPGARAEPEVPVGVVLDDAFGDCAWCSPSFDARSSLSASEPVLCSTNSIREVMESSGPALPAAITTRALAPGLLESKLEDSPPAVPKNGMATSITAVNADPAYTERSMRRTPPDV